MLNHITLQGRMAMDPELKSTASGIKVVTIRIAVERDYNGDGERKVDFINCVAWRQKAEFICRYFRKGDPILVDGRLEMRNWEDREGSKHTSAEVNLSNVWFCGTRKREEAKAENSEFSGAQTFEELDDDDGELPFDLGDDELPL